MQGLVKVQRQVAMYCVPEGSLHGALSRMDTICTEVRIVQRVDQACVGSWLLFGLVWCKNHFK